MTRCFLATLSKEEASNWEICKRHGLWGSGTSSHAKHAASLVEAGDLVVVWQATAGLLAAARAQGAAQQVGSGTTVPWPSPERYLYTLPIEVLVELDEPVPDRFEGQVSARFGLRIHFLQSGFIVLPDDVARRVLEVFDLSLSRPPADHRGSRRPAAGVHLRQTSSVVEAMLGLYRIAGHDDGELLVVGSEEQREQFDREVVQPPFAEMRDRFRFVTPGELIEQLQAGLEGGVASWR